ncbi:putative phosphatidylinositol N-acetylglucosaminyltransferase [Helianthus anomalus]
MADPSIISNPRFTYVHDHHKNAVDTHHIIARRSTLKPIVLYLIAILLVAYSVFLHLEKGKPVTTVIWSFFFSAIMVKLLIWRPIVKESVVIMPEFGVQLETHYGSGRINRRFIPVSKILKPVLNECVTPVTCCWCLSFLIRDETELTLVFKKFRPPLKMLVPIWKALCVATDCKESFEIQEDG